MDTDEHTDDQIRKILSYSDVAVVGISRDPNKAAHYVPKYLSENGYNIIPVNPSANTILEKKCHDKPSQIKSKVDIVDVFRPSEDVLPVVQDAILLKPKVIWLQEGIHNPKAEELARAAGIDVVYNRCMLAEHRRLC